MFPKKLASKISEFSLGDELDPCQCCAHRPKFSDSQSWSIPGLPISKKKKGSKATTELLTGQQRLVVLRTWYVLSSDIPSLGISTMLKMLELDRRAETLFDFFGKTGETLVQDRQFRQHAFWLIQAVSAVVENLDKLDVALEDMFLEIGEKHAAIPQFSEGYIGVLPDSWSFVWEDQLKERYSAHTSKSWDKIFKYIVDHLLQGFHRWTLDHVASMVDISAAFSTLQTSGTNFSSTSTDSNSNSESECEDSSKWKVGWTKGTSNSKKPLVGPPLPNSDAKHAPGTSEGLGFNVDNLSPAFPDNATQDIKQRSRDKSGPTSSKDSKNKSSKDSKNKSSELSGSQNTEQSTQSSFDEQGKPPLAPDSGPRPSGQPPATSKPVPATSKPVSATSKPVPATSKPVSATSEPVSATSKPVPATSESMPTTSEPVPATSKPVPERRPTSGKNASSPMTQLPKKN